MLYLCCYVVIKTYFDFILAYYQAFQSIYIKGQHTISVAACSIWFFNQSETVETKLKMVGAWDVTLVLFALLPYSYIICPAWAKQQPVSNLIYTFLTVTLSRRFRLSILQKTFT